MIDITFYCYLINGIIPCFLYLFNVIIVSQFINNKNKKNEQEYIKNR